MLHCQLDIDINLNRGFIQNVTSSNFLKLKSSNMLYVKMLSCSYVNIVCIVCTKSTDMSNTNSKICYNMNTFE